MLVIRRFHIKPASPSPSTLQLHELRPLPALLDRQPTTATSSLLADLVGFDMCWAFDLADPWGNLYELSCYDCERIRTELVEACEVQADRKWPRGALARTTWTPSRPSRSRLGRCP